MCRRSSVGTYACNDHQPLDLDQSTWDHRSIRAGHEKSVRKQGMAKVNELGYVGISSLDLEAWQTYATNVLGQEVAYDSDADNLFLKMDGHHHRLSVHPGEVEDVAFVGWEVGSADNMQAVAAQL